MAKKIFVAAQYFRPEGGTVAGVYGARGTYLNKLESQGLIPILVTPHTNFDALVELLKECAGAFFMGGCDIAPSYYNQTPRPETKPGDPKRDEVELELM